MQKLLRALHKQEEGFTLVELMVVVVIIGILVAIAIPIFGAVTGGAEESACFANQRTVEGAAMMYRAEEGQFPDQKGSALFDELDAYLEPDEAVCGDPDDDWDDDVGIDSDTGRLTDSKPQCDHGYFRDAEDHD